MSAPKGACLVPMLTTVALSFPPTNARAFARSLRDLLPKGQSDWLYRKRIDAIRDAFVHVAQEKVADHAASKIAAAARAQLPAAPGAQGMAGAAGAQLPAAVGAQGPEHTSVAFLHIHDESTVRLRSFSSAEVAGMYGPVRSRSSIVQVHVCSLWATPTEGHPLLVELDALHNKTAGTLATSLDGVVRLAVSTVRKGMEAAPAASGEVWFVHVLVGDGISTNAAAARKLLALYLQSPLAQGVRYFLLPVTCANHQCNLVVGSCVDGNAAAEARRT